MDFLEHLAQTVERTGHTIKREKSFFIVEPINLKIETEIGERNEHNVNGLHSVVLNISIKATHEQMFPEGIWDCLAGVGENDEQAYSSAAHIWTQGVFSPIHEILVPIETKDFQVTRLDMLTRNQETGEEFGWKMFLGAYYAAGELSTRTDFDEITLVQRLLNAITSVLLEKRLFWLKIYIAKSSSSETEILGNCWLNNQDWIEGLNELYWFAQEWKEVKSFAAMKQFIIIKPCEIREIRNAEKLRQSLPPMEKQGFFSKLFGK